MACRLFGAEPSPDPVLTYSELDLKEKASGEVKSKLKHFRNENEFEKVVCKMVAILSRPKCCK